MTVLTKLPGFQRSPPGLEWTVLRRLPMVALAATALPIVAVLVASVVLGDDPANAKLVVTIQILLASLLVLLWTAVFTVALLCVIVLIAKGPAYVADAYPLIDFDRPAR